MISDTIIVLLYIITTSLNYLVQYIGNGINKKDPRRIWDIVWDNTPDLNEYAYIKNILPVSLLASVFFIKDGFSIFYEFFTKFILILIIRSATVISTIFPKYAKCRLTGNTIEDAIGGCYDKIFSGHTSFVALFTLILLNKNKINPLIFWILNIFEMSIITLSRSHFTVDVILGFVISYLIYNGNYSINNPLGK